MHIIGKYYFEDVVTYKEIVPGRLKDTKQQLDLFKIDCKRYPTNSEGLRVLLEKNRPKDCVNFNPKGYADYLPTNSETEEIFEYSSINEKVEISTSWQVDGKTIRYRLIDDEIKREE